MRKPLGIWLETKRGQISQMDLAVAAGTTPASVSRIESGLQNPSDKLLLKIVDALAGVDATEDEREALRREARAAKAGLLEGVASEPAAPDEGSILAALSAYSGNDPLIVSLKTTAELLHASASGTRVATQGIERPSRIVGRILPHFEHLPTNILEVAVDQATEAAENVYDATFRHIVELQISKEPGVGQPRIRPADRALPMPSQATSPLDEVLAEAIRSRSR